MMTRSSLTGESYGHELGSKLESALMYLGKGWQMTDRLWPSLLFCLGSQLHGSSHRELPL